MDSIWVDKTCFELSLLWLRRGYFCLGLKMSCNEMPSFPIIWRRRTLSCLMGVNSRWFNGIGNRRFRLKLPLLGAFIRKMSSLEYNIVYIACCMSISTFHITYHKPDKMALSLGCWLQAILRTASITKAQHLNPPSSILLSRPTKSSLMRWVDPLQF